MSHNMKLRATAEAISSGLQTARTEALRLNRQVEFVLTDDDPDAANVAAPNVTTAGPNYMVRANMGAGAYTFVEGRAGREGQNQADTAAPNAQIAAVVPISTLPGLVADVVTFNSVGRAELAANATFDVSNPAGGACRTAGGDEPMRCLRVVVTPGGQVRMCDPAVADKSDSRSC
jgi:type IV fimbrial biogenesis protein FimT